MQIGIFCRLLLIHFKFLGSMTSFGSSFFGEQTEKQVVNQPSDVMRSKMAVLGKIEGEN